MLPAKFLTFPGNRKGGGGITINFFKKMLLSVILSLARHKYILSMITITAQNKCYHDNALIYLGEG